jgi:hypothetical protein
MCEPPVRERNAPSQNKLSSVHTIVSTSVISHLLYATIASANPNEIAIATVKIFRMEATPA